MEIIDLMIQEHEHVEHILKVTRRVCLRLMENKDVYVQLFRYLYLQLKKVGVYNF